MKRDRALEIIDNFQRLRLLVLGDLMLDEFIWGEVRRISPEAPVPVVEVRRETFHLGGAANVAQNVLSLGGNAGIVGVIGNDLAGDELRNRAAGLGAETYGIVVDPSRPTTLKTRIVAHSQQMVRFDREDRRAIGPEIETEITKRLADALAESDAVVISDYEKGLLTPQVLRSSIEAAHTHDRMVCLDPKLRNWSSYEGVDVITPNQLEAERATGIELVDDDSILAAAARIRSMLSARSVLLTRGEHGMSLLDENGRFTNIPTVAREVYDVTGAGDTVIATLSLSLAAGASLEEAAIIANHAAGIVVGKVGTAGVTAEELGLEFKP
jgi:D-glycero-beta-D-manno-heptose-7-phosphate kinase